MYNKIMVLLWRAIILVYSGIFLLLAGCSEGSRYLTERTIAGTAVPETSPAETAEAPEPPAHTGGKPGAGEAAPGLPTMAGYEYRPEAYRVMRLVDPCALHSPKDAGRVTDLVPDEIMPGRSLNMCALQLIRKSGDLPRWTLTTTVGVDVGENVRGRGQLQDLAGNQYWYLPLRSEASGTTDDCVYIKEFGPKTGIELRVVKRDEEDKRDPCKIARDYLVAVSKWWINPAPREAKVTTPSVPIAGIDPCAVLGTVAAELGQPLQASLSDPHSCALQPTKFGAKGSYGGLLVLDYKLETDPLAVLKGALSSEYRSVTIGGRPGALTQLSMPGMDGQKRVTCYVTVLVDDRLSLQADQSRPDAVKTYQVVATRSPDCQLAERGAEAALAAIR